MSRNITNVKLNFSCSESWDDMSLAEGGRHCDKCRKKVYDFTNSKVDEFRKVLAENGNTVCGRFKTEQVAFIPMAYPFWKKWLSAALVVVGFNFWGKEAMAQHTRPKQVKQKVKIPPKVTMGDVQIIERNKVMPSVDSLNRIKLEEQEKSEPETSNYMFGMISEVQPEFPGGYQKFTAFVNKNLDPSKTSKTGRINITFVVETDGSLNDIQAVGRIFDQSAADEALRVIKLSPKWIPGKRNGKLVRIQYTVPILFTN